MQIPKYIVKKINKARELTLKLEAIRAEIIEWDYKVNAENIPYRSANASNLSEAIQCYIDYGEYLYIDENNEVIPCLK